MDHLVRDEIFSSALTSAVFGATGATTLTANTANSAVATAGVLSGAFVKQMVARLKGANVPQFADGTYRCIIHPAQEYDLISDTAVNGWIESRKYVDNTGLLTGEIGMFAGVDGLDLLCAEGRWTVARLGRSRFGALRLRSSDLA